MKINKNKGTKAARNIAAKRYLQPYDDSANLKLTARHERARIKQIQ